MTYKIRCLICKEVYLQIVKKEQTEITKICTACDKNCYRKWVRK